MLAVADLIEYKPRKGLKTAWRPGYVVALYPHHVEVHPSHHPETVVTIPRRRVRELQGARSVEVQERIRQIRPKAYGDGLYLGQTHRLPEQLATVPVLSLVAGEGGCHV